MMNYSLHIDKVFRPYENVSEFLNANFYWKKNHKIHIDEAFLLNDWAYGHLEPTVEQTKSRTLHIYEVFHWCGYVRAFYVWKNRRKKVDRNYTEKV